MARHRQLTIAFFGGLGQFSAAHLAALARVHHVVGVFSGLQRRGARALAGRLLRAVRLRPDPCGAVARRHKIPRWYVERDAAEASRLVASLRPDVICVAGYPWLLPPDIWQRPRLGTLNSHPSLLPRHRGILPLFWIYYHDDHETGVTVHRVNERSDAGEIVRQERFPLERAFPVDCLNLLNANRGSQQLLLALDDVSGGRPGVPQDETQATRAPFVDAAAPMADFTWDVERVWHFLGGLFPRYVEPLRDLDSRPVMYGRVLGYERGGQQHPAGTVSRASVGWHLHCNGGVVHLASIDRRAGRADPHA